MAISLVQSILDRYHEELRTHGHNMYDLHRAWHVDNRDPIPPIRPDPNWGADLRFGGDFLQMHHEMVAATDDEPKQFMHHQSLTSFHQTLGEAVPAPWNPVEPIPDELSYTPQLGVFPSAVQDQIRQRADELGIIPERLLERNAVPHGFTLPRWFTEAGVGSGEDVEPYTGARRLADFVNTNQLGCCLVFPHNRWHGAIGGAMRSTATAIADPIFYWGVHRHVEAVYMNYRRLQEERGLLLAAERMEEFRDLVGKRKVKDRFTEEQERQRRQDIRSSLLLATSLAGGVAAAMPRDASDRYVVQRGEDIRILVRKTMAPFLAIFPDTAAGMPLRLVNRDALSETREFTVSSTASAFAVAITCAFAGAPDPNDRYEFEVTGSQSGTGTPPPLPVLGPHTPQFAVVRFQAV